MGKGPSGKLIYGYAYQRSCKEVDVLAQKDYGEERMNAEGFVPGMRVDDNQRQKSEDDTVPWWYNLNGQKQALGRRPREGMRMLG